MTKTCMIHDIRIVIISIYQSVVVNTRAIKSYNQLCSEGCAGSFFLSGENRCKCKLKTELAFLN